LAAASLHAPLARFAGAMSLLAACRVIHATHRWQAAAPASVCRAWRPLRSSRACAPDRPTWAAGHLPRSLATRVAPEHEVQWFGLNPNVPEGPRVSHLPEWAKQEQRPPASLRFLGMALLTPLGIGAAGVHLFAGEAADEESDQAEYSRTILSWSLHYAGVLLSSAGAMHWGMQLAEFGVPRKSEYMGIYYLSRYTAPITFVLFGWLGSVLSASLPREASLWLLCGYAGLFTCDFFARAFEVAPPWWFRWRAGFSLTAVAFLLLLLLSERNVYLGDKPRMRM